MGCNCSKTTSVVRPSSTSADNDIRATYRLGPILGTGSFGQVRVCMHRQTEKQFACKIMTKNSQRARKSGTQTVDFVNMFRNEIEILRSIDHAHVVRLVSVFEDRHFLYAVMEKCEGGELFTKIVQRRKFNEVDASRLCRDMISAIAYVHKQGIVHRDIKAENFLFSHKLPTNATGSISDGMRGTSRLVLIDFGMSVRLTEADKYLRQVCGSPHYVAPELIKRRYRQEVDLWALGVIVFLMLYGRYPFEGSDQKQIAQRILRNEPDYHRTSTRPSPGAINFVKGLLEKDPQKRLTSDQAFRHAWIMNNGQHVSSEEVVPSPMSQSSSVQSMEDLPPQTDERMLKLSESLNQESVIFAEEEEDNSAAIIDDSENEEENASSLERADVDSRAWDSESQGKGHRRRRATGSTIGSSPKATEASVKLKLRQAALALSNRKRIEAAST